MDLHDAIFGRRSVREYLPQPVDDKLLDQLINAAVYAPNAINQQPCTFSVVRDQNVLSRVSQAAKEHMLATMPAGFHTDHFRSRLTDPNYQIFYNAPVLVLISASGQGPWIVEDCALAAQNLMLCAYGLGLGTCWIGFAQNFLNTSEGKYLLDLPAEWAPVAPIIVGHPKTIPIDVPRRTPRVHNVR